MYKIYPNVKKMDFLSNNNYILPNKFIVFFLNETVNAFNKLCARLECVRGTRKEADILFLADSGLDKEAYWIDITGKGITVGYGCPAGAYYAAVTLLQIIKQAAREIKALRIEDSPDLKIRGLMMDISRDKVPQVATIKNIINMMADVKMNHLELYVEGFSFGYPSFARYLEEDGYISVQEYKEIEAYAAERYVDLVPNQNGFGHMAKWLEKEEFKDLAEQPEGIFLWGRSRRPATLNPLDPGSLELIRTLYKDMLSISQSRYFNMNFDEPFELGKGKSKYACDERGPGNVYIDYVLKAYAEIKKYDKTPLIWGDVLIKHPELLHRLPPDIIFVDWGYDGGYPFSKNLKILKELGINFMAAPATTSWCSFAGRTFDWWENISNACLYTKLYGGLGIILTDWGDFGHLQFLPVSYPPLIYAGMMSWRVKEGTYFYLRNYLNKEIFDDRKNIMADAMLDLGNYYRYLNEYRSNGTATFYNFMWAVHALSETEPCAYYKERTECLLLSYDKYITLDKFLSLKGQEIHRADLSVADGALIKQEMLQTILFIKNIHKLNIAYNEDVELKTRVNLLEEVLLSKEDFLEKQKELWLLRNKSGGLKDSLSYVHRFYLFVERTLHCIRGVENET